MLSFYCSFSLYAQKKENDNIKNEIIIYNSNEKKRTPKKQLANYLKYILNNTSHGKVNYCEAMNIEDSISCDRYLPIKDSIQAVLRIVNITRHRNNYQIVNGRLKRVNVYFIDVSLEKNTLADDFNVVRILSVDEKGKKLNRLRVGKCYPLLLISYFDKDCCRVYSKNGIIPIIGHSTLINIILNKTWIYGLRMDKNYYTSPNLKGLHYFYQ